MSSDGAAGIEAARAALAGSPGDVVLGEAPFDGPTIRSTLDDHLGGAPYVVRGVTIGVTARSDSLLFDGAADFLGAEMAVVVTMTEEIAGDPALQLRFQPPPSWRFAPTQVAEAVAADGTAGPANGRRHALGDLDRLVADGALTGLAFSVPSADPRVRAAGGFDTTATFEPGGGDGLLSAVVGPEPVNLTGSFLPLGAERLGLPAPTVTDRRLFDPAAAFGGDGSDLATGWTWRGDVPTSMRLGPLSFGPGQVRIHAGDRPPADGAELTPSPGWVGSLGFAGIDVPVMVATPSDGASLEVAVAPGCALGGMGALAEIAAPDQIGAAVPDDLSALLVAVPTIELQSLELAVRVDEGRVAVERAAVSVRARTSWPLIDGVLDVRLDGLTLEVLDPFGEGAGRSVTVGAAGTVTVFGVACEVSARCAPEVQVVVARMPRSERVPLGKLLADLLPGVAAPFELAVTGLEVATFLQPLFAVSVTVELEDPTTFTWGTPLRPTGLTGLVLRLTAGSGGLLSGELAARLVVGGAPIDLTAASPGPGGGWSFSGVLAPGVSVPVGALLADLLPDAELPGLVRDLAIERLAVSYDTGRGDAAFEGRAATTVPIDLGPVTPEARLGLRIDSEVDAQGVRRTRGRLEGEMEIGGATFEVVLELSSARGRLQATASGLDNLDPVRLAEAFGCAPDALRTVLTESGIGLRRVAFEVDLWSPQGSGVTLALDATRVGRSVLSVRRSPSGGWEAWFGFVLAEGGWDPGALWAPLSSLHLSRAALLCCTTSPPVDRVRELVSPAATPAVLQRGLTVKRGVTVIASVRAVAPLDEVFGDASLDLFASFDPWTGDISVKARSDMSTVTGDFAFDYLELEWVGTGSNVTVAVRSAGRLAIAGEHLRFGVSGRVSSSGTGSLQLSVADWVHPFGCQRLTINQLVVNVGVDTAGVTIGLGGAFAFTTRHGVAFRFAVFASILNFAAPGAALFRLDPASPGQDLTLSQVIEGITDIDLDELEATAGQTVAGGLATIDRILQIRKLHFWVVLSGEIELAGEVHGRGFGFRGDITLFGVPVILEVDVQQDKGRFSGRAELPEAVVIGDVLTLARPAVPTERAEEGVAVARRDDTGQGPLLSVSSYLDDTHEHYLDVAARVRLLDVFEATLVARATSDGLVFSYDLQAGSSGDGAWLDQHVDVLVSSEQRVFRAGLRCDFGLHDVILGGFYLFDLIWLPEARLPDLTLLVDLDLRAEVTPPTFHLSGTLDFTAFGQACSTDFRIDLDLRDAPGELAEIGAAVLAWLKENLAALLAEVLDTAEQVAEWVGARFDEMADAADQVAQVLLEVFDVGAARSATLLKEAGYQTEAIAGALNQVFELGSAVALATLVDLGLDSDAVAGAMRDVFAWTDPLLLAADQTFAGFAAHVEDFLATRDVDLVLFNLTEHRLRVVGSEGGEITPRVGLEVRPGGADTVARFHASTGRWEWVFVRDMDDGVDYQLYIEMSPVIGNRHVSLGYRADRRSRHDSNLNPLTPSVATAVWAEGSPVATYTLAALPTPIIRPPYTFVQGWAVHSPSGRANLVFQEDGNLVIYDELGHPRWSSKTARGQRPQHGAHCQFQPDGNLVVYDEAGNALWWAIEQPSSDNARLAVQDDGNVVIYAGGHIMWAAHTTP